MVYSKILGSNSHHIASNGWTINDGIRNDVEVNGYSLSFGTSPISSWMEYRKPGKTYVRFEVSPVVTMKNVVFWDVTPCGSCKN
jgi:hypothetical protein